MKPKDHNNIDKLIIAFDNFLRQHKDISIDHAYPAKDLPDTPMTETETSHVAGLMRVNHSGEIAAQSLYKAQSLTARKKELKLAMQQSAKEEIAHLNWCGTRLRELDSNSSRLKFFWLTGSFGIGLIAGVFGDKWSLGFLVETENQVVRHLDKHLTLLPPKDKRSHAILEQMRKDELHHAQVAKEAGAEELPKTIKKMMQITAKVMTKTAYYI